MPRKSNLSHRKTTSASITAAALNFKKTFSLLKNLHPAPTAQCRGKSETVNESEMTHESNLIMSHPWATFASKRCCYFFPFHTLLVFESCIFFTAQCTKINQAYTNRDSTNAFPGPRVQNNLPAFST